MLPRRRPDTRRRLLEAARAELLASGGGLEMSAVAARAGLSVGLSYHYFGSKAGLVAAVVEEFYDRYEREVMNINPLPGADWARRERARLERVIDFHYRDPLAPLILKRLSREPEVAAVEARRIERQVDLGTRNVRLGQKEGLIPRELDANLLVAMMMGGLRQALGEALERRRRPPRAWLAAELWASIAALARLSPESPVTNRRRSLHDGPKKR